jgi:hypothetical protein
VGQESTPGIFDWEHEDSFSTRLQKDQARRDWIFHLYTVSDYVRVPIERGGGIASHICPSLGERTVGYICGGFARWMASPHEMPAQPEDIDVFFPNLVEHEKALSAASDLGWKDISFNPMLHRRFKTKKDDGFGELTVNFIVPLKCKWFVTGGTLSDVLKDFDFTICAAAFLPEAVAGERACILVHKNFLEHETARKLVFQTLRDPYHEVANRIPKYVKKGYHLPQSSVQPLFDTYETIEFDRVVATANKDWKELAGYNPKKQCHERDYALHYRIDWAEAIIR